MKRHSEQALLACRGHAERRDVDERCDSRAVLHDQHVARELLNDEDALVVDGRTRPQRILETRRYEFGRQILGHGR